MLPRRGEKERSRSRRSRAEVTCESRLFAREPRGDEGVCQSGAGAGVGVGGVEVSEVEEPGSANSSRFEVEVAGAGRGGRSISHCGEPLGCDGLDRGGGEASRLGGAGDAEPAVCGSAGDAGAAAEAEEAACGRAGDAEPAAWGGAVEGGAAACGDARWRERIVASPISPASCRDAPAVDGPGRPPVHRTGTGGEVVPGAVRRDSSGELACGCGATAAGASLDPAGEAIGWTDPPCVCRSCACDCCVVGGGCG